MSVAVSAIPSAAGSTRTLARMGSVLRRSTTPWTRYRPFTRSSRRTVTSMAYLASSRLSRFSPAFLVLRLSLLPRSRCRRRDCGRRGEPPQTLPGCSGAASRCPLASTGCSATLLSAYRPLELLDGGLEGRIVLDASLGHARRMDDGRVVAREDVADVREGDVEKSSAEVHRELPRDGDVAAPALRAEIRRAK